MYFCTGADERKNKNIERNPHVILTTGCNSLKEGMDVVVEGDAVQMRDDALLQRVAGEYLSKYGEGWRFTVRGGAFVNQESGVALVYEVSPKTAFGFGKGEPYSQTRWRF